MNTGAFNVLRSMSKICIDSYADRELHILTWKIRFKSLICFLLLKIKFVYSSFNLLYRSPPHLIITTHNPIHT